ncbi:MAG TPA: hypothetical protein PKD11_15215, partial [Pyrinomonadaceae bacterium]|nr:hypothetical protein [Pyrinomonadaceae bacterium]
HLTLNSAFGIPHSALCFLTSHFSFLTYHFMHFVQIVQIVHIAQIALGQSSRILENSPREAQFDI